MPQASVHTMRHRPILYRSLRSLLMGSAMGVVVLSGGALGSEAPPTAAAVGVPSTTAPGGPQSQQPQQPTVLNADRITYDESGGLITAIGNVEITQGQRSVRAEKMTYDRNKKIVVATGNVRLVEPNGDILYANYAELTDDMRDAFIDNIRMLMSDNARLVGNEGERRGGDVIRVNRGVYSPCDLCKDDPTKAPIWQVKAVRIVHDKEKQEVRYHDAYLEMFGVPIAYTPYLAHPDGTVDRRSGLLAPEMGHRTDLGFFFTGRYYFDITPDQDATVALTPYSTGAGMVAGEYRKRFEDGELTLRGSIANGPLHAADGSEKGDHVRANIAAKGLFNLDDTWRWGFDINRSSDRTYLRQFQNIKDDFLNSRLYMEGFRDRNYALIAAYSFQDLRVTTVDNPKMVPRAIWSAYGDPGSMFGGRWQMDSQILSVYRGEGTNTVRVSFDPSWQRQFISSSGLVTTAHTQLLMESYRASDYTRPDETNGTRGETYRNRVYPEIDVTTRYPFVHYAESYSHVIEPIAQLKSATRVKNDAKNPNEDSLDFEFSDANLFSPSRYNGIDRLEGGSRYTYGLHSTWRANQGHLFGVFLGQSYRLTGPSDYPNESGLTNRLSDVVGRVDAAYSPWVSTNYSFRVSTDPYKVQRQAVGMNVGDPRLLSVIQYQKMNPLTDPYNTITRSKSELLNLALIGKISDKWKFVVAHQQSFANDPGPRASVAKLTYQDECFTFDTVVTRAYSDTSDTTDNGLTAYFRLTFKNLGEIQTPTL